MTSIWEDVKGRRIFRAATLYAAIAWGIIQIADILLPVLQYPDWLMSSMVVIAFTGFPIALIFGWLIDIKNDRRIVSTIDGVEPINSSFKTRVVEFLIIIVFAGIAGILFYNSQIKNKETTDFGLTSVKSLTEDINNQKTIAVLPFSNFSDSKSDEYFADGLSEELLNVLAKNKLLRVAARTSSFQYKNKNLNIKTIAKELGVQYILEGSVRRSGDKIRVTAQLIKADEDVHIFSSTWDKDISNIFKVQDEIALSVLETLEIKLLGKESNSESLGTKSIAAFAEYSKGVAAVRNRSKEDFKNAKSFFNSAINIDPQYAEAFAMLAETYLLEASYDFSEPADAQVAANNYIEKALSLNSELAIAHSVKGLFHWQRADGSDNKEAELQSAKRHLNMAIQLNPSNAEAYMWYGSILLKSGEYSDGMKLRKKAYEIDPQAAVVGFNRADDLIRQGEYESAMIVFNNIVRNNPNYENAYAIAGEISLVTGDLEQAYYHFKKARDLGGDNKMWRLKSNQIYLPIGEFDKAQANLDFLMNNKSKHTQSKMIENYLQPELWLASGQIDEIKKWISTFDRETNQWNERLWRGYFALDAEKWSEAIEEFEFVQRIVDKKTSPLDDNLLIRTNLLLSKAWKAQGDSIKSENYVNMASSKIDYLIKEQNFNPIKFRYQQAAIANLSGNQLDSLNLLKQAIQEGFVEIWNLKMDPLFDNLRSDPIYVDLIAQLEIKLDEFRKAIKNLDEEEFAML
ncbi:MAG: hypothetical protein COA86_15425 [Kangiella sp.]|nr:MAG: hypothetical protein COA86_15425 [Kangiella sp.]